MVIRLALLILFVLALAGPHRQARAAQVGCLECHPVHYGERGGCVDCHRGTPRTLRQEIAHHGLVAARFAHFTLEGSPVTERGLQALKDYACRRCHRSGGTGNRLAADLDRSAQQSTPEELAAAIRHPVLFMPDFRFPEARIVELVNALLAGSQAVEPPQGEAPLVIHFEEKGQGEQNAFVKHCGGCHRLLTEKHGGLGTGSIAPNLSGLFTEHYLPNYGEQKQRWNAELLEKWLKNPRAVRPLSQMAPVALKESEWRELLEIFQDDMR